MQKPLAEVILCIMKPYIYNIHIYLYLFLILFTVYINLKPDFKGEINSLTEFRKKFESGRV